MLDPRSEALVVSSKDGSTWEDKTTDVSEYRIDGDTVHVKFANADKLFPYNARRVAILRQPEVITIPPDSRIQVRGTVWSGRPEVVRFSGTTGAWYHILTTTSDGESCYSCSEPEFRLIRSAGSVAGPAEVLAYWRALVARLPADDALRRPFASLDFVHPDSALARFLTRGTVQSCEIPLPLILPFGSNLSQREAVRKALSHPISVVEGPPGTGKTQTILNIIANVLLAGSTVGVVSFNNAAVDNVREKLDRIGLSFVAAGLGRSSKRQEFFAEQGVRNSAVTRFVEDTNAADYRFDPNVLLELDRRVSDFQEIEQRLAVDQLELDASRLERDHFERSLEGETLPDLTSIPLLRKSSDKLMSYLVETQLRQRTPATRFRRLTQRLSDYFKYGATFRLDPEDTDAVLGLQASFYEKCIAELTGRVREAEGKLEAARFETLREEHANGSLQVLRRHLAQRYSQYPRTEWDAAYRYQMTKFSRDYPVILSTCHSLRASIGDGTLLDYLIVDEASQVNLLAAAPALACARNVVVVGDLKQLAHIVAKELQDFAQPDSTSPYDYHLHSLLSSVGELFGSAMPRTLLKEHYRCHPDIIGFSNKKFYDGELVPYTQRTQNERPLVTYRTSEGNHMRLHRDGARSNQREIDVIVNEVIPLHCAEFQPGDVGVTTPYRRQADQASDVLAEGIASDTVHKFQGREKPAVVMTTVLDETWHGRKATKFVDDPRLVNVAVTRAINRFVLVTNYDMMPSSRHLRDLIGYVEYHNPGDSSLQSRVTSVFDLLYRSYSRSLEPFARRLRGDMRFRSEDIVWTHLLETLSQPTYAGIRVAPQVLLRNLFADTSRLDARQQSYMKHRASVDFVLYNRVTNQAGFAIEVDGFAFHENNPQQRVRDAVKNSIFEHFDLPLLRLPTTASDELDRIEHSLLAMVSDVG